MNIGVLCCGWMQTDIYAGGATARRSALFTMRQHGAHGAVHVRTIYSTASDYSTARTAQCAFRGATARHGTTHRPATALHARRSAHTGELQHGAMHYSTSATYRPKHGTHGAVRTPGSYSTAPCAAAPRRCKVLAQTRALQDIAGHRATRAPPKHSKDRDAPHTRARAWRTRRRAIGLRCYGYLDPRGH
jgi:hypothetical protein